MQKSSVLIVQNIVPHYRLPFFRRLACSDAVELSVAYGDEYAGSFLPSVHNPAGIREIPVKNLFAPKGQYVFFQRGLLRHLFSRKFDTIIADFDVHLISSVIACLLARVVGIKFMWWGHGIGPAKRTLSKRFRLLLSRFSDGLIFYSGDHAELFVQWGVPRRKTFVAWNSIDMGEIEHLVLPWGAMPRHRIVFIGRLIPEKKPMLLVKAFIEALTRLDARTHLTVIGDGPEREQLEQAAVRAGIIDRVEFCGALYTQEELAPYFNTAQICVSPGYIGLNAVHSLAYGVPLLVADREPHSPEICVIEEGKTGIYFESDNVSALAEQLVGLQGKPGVLEAMSAEARRTIGDKFTIDAMVRSFEDAIRTVNQANRPTIQQQRV